MRAIALAFAALAISCHAFEDDLYLREPVQIDTLDEGKLVAFLEKVKQWLKTGHDKPAIPVLDPFKRDHLDLNINNQLITLDGTLDNVRAIGLSNFDVLKGDFSKIGLKASIRLNWTDIDLMTKYHITKAKLAGDMSLWGTGTIMAVIQGLTVDVDLSISLNGDHKLYVKELDLKVALNTLKFHANGLLDDNETSKILSKKVSELAPQILVDYQREVSELGGKLVRKMLNEVLSKLSMGDLIDMIFG